jgi:hypothetical protein
MTVGRDPLRWLLGTPFDLPSTLVQQFPELACATWRRGGLALRIGGWLLGKRSVAGITLWRSISLAPDARLDPELLLHELRHVLQFQSDPLFPLRYLWGSVRYGYTQNPFERDARAYAAHRLAGGSPTA